MDSQTMFPPRNRRFSEFALLVLLLAAFLGVWLVSDVLYPNFVLPEEISLVVSLRDGAVLSYGEKLLASPFLSHLFGRGLFFVFGESFPPLLAALCAVPLFALLVFLVRCLVVPGPFRLALLVVAVASLPLALFLTSSPGLTLALALAGTTAYCLLSYALRETVFHLFIAGFCIGALPFAEPFFLYYILGLVPLLWMLLSGGFRKVFALHVVLFSPVLLFLGGWLLLEWIYGAERFLLVPLPWAFRGEESVTLLWTPLFLALWGIVLGVFCSFVASGGMPSENAFSSAKNAARKDLSMFRIFWFVHVFLLGVIWFFGGEKERLVLLAFGALLLLAGAAVLRMRTFCVCGFFGLFACFAVLGWWELPGASLVTRAWIDGLHGKDTAVMLYGSDVEAAHWLRKFRSGEEKAFLRGDGGDAVRFFAARSKTRAFLPVSRLIVSQDETPPFRNLFPEKRYTPLRESVTKEGTPFLVLRPVSVAPRSGEITLFENAHWVIAQEVPETLSVP